MPPAADSDRGDPSSVGVMARPGGTRRVRVAVVDADRPLQREDHVVTEEPLEVRVAAAGARPVPFTVTMRTPGNDFELAVGVLHAEGVLLSRETLRTVAYCTDRDIGEPQRYNVVTVELAGPAPAALAERARPLTSSACGVCGATTLDVLTVRCSDPLPGGPSVPAGLLRSLPDRLREHQRLFAATGGLHAAGLLDADGTWTVREDVGRHNAVDKVLGRALLDGRLPLTGCLLAVSGRAGFEIVQKALVAGVPVVCAVSAPTSLAVDLAERFGMTLVGFAREGRFTVYAGAERIAL